MRGPWLRWGLVLLSFSCLAAGNPARGEDAGAVGGPAIWQLKDEDTTVYFFGTIHLTGPDEGWQTTRFQEIWNAADALYLETDLSHEGRRAAQEAFPTLGRNEPGVTLDTLLSKEGRVLLRLICSETGTSIDDLQPLRPWLAKLVLFSAFARAQGQNLNTSIDHELVAMAGHAAKAVRILETPGEQIQMLASPPDEAAAASLEALLQLFRDDPDFLEATAQAWRNGEADSFAVSIPEGPAAQVVNTVFRKRNEIWSEEIIRLMNEEKGVFLVAVGASHLVGPHSLPDQLSEVGLMASRL